MTRQQLELEITNLVTEKLGQGLDLTRLDVSASADTKFGDFATNAAMVYAKDLGKSPRDVAEELLKDIKAIKAVEHAEVAGPGFINITLTNEAFGEAASAAPKFKPTGYEGKVVVAEYSDPNPFKVLHVGHLYTTVVGDAISNLLEAAGGTVHKVNFGGDVGLHVAKTTWAILQELGGENPDGLKKIDTAEHSAWMAKCYVAGTQAYAEDDEAKAVITKLNARIYEIHAQSDHESPLAQIYWTCRQWSYDYFNQFYARIGSEFERFYPESETAPLGQATVREQLAKGVYKESQGAIVFEGEPHGLHTRVFITSQGLPTYEGKDVGLIMKKWQDYRFDRSIVITGNDIIEYMKVVLKSIEQFEPELVARSTHLTHGNVKLAGGAKMSSRKGNFLRAVDVLEMAAEANLASTGKHDDRVVLGAVKYSFLKQRIGADLVFIPEESVSLDGNSGPYLQYAHARARSILAKAGEAKPAKLGALDASERMLAAKIAEFGDVVQRAVDEMLPHHIASYLYELAQTFNRFYEVSRVIDDEREAQRLKLVALYAGVLSVGLGLLGIEAPERL